MTRKDQILQNHRTNTAIAFGSKFYRRNACHARSFNIPLVGMNAPELAGIFSFPVLTNPPTQLYAWVKIASIGYCLQNGYVHHLLVIVYICICIYIYIWHWHLLQSSWTPIPFLFLTKDSIYANMVCGLWPSTPHWYLNLSWWIHDQPIFW